DCTFAAPLEHIRVCLELLASGVAASERPALKSHMLIEDRAGEAEGAGIDGLGEQRRDAPGLLRDRLPLHRRLAHDEMAEGRQGREETKVERGLAALGGIEELRKALPVPG